MDEFDRVLSGIVDSTLGFRCKLFGYQYSEIIRSLMCVYFCGGTCIEDLSKHLIPCVSQHPKLRTCSSDTILRAIEELTEDNRPVNAIDILSSLVLTSGIAGRSVIADVKRIVSLDVWR